jgi:creatinine amidohydrolase
MTWPEVGRYLEKSNIVFVPVGSTEQHGMHLPVDNDWWTANEIAIRTADRVSQNNINVLVTHPLAFGVSQHHMGFPGTITLRIQTFVDVIEDICTSLSKHGFKKIVIFNGHGGNEAALSVAIHDLAEQIASEVYVINWWELIIDEIRRTCDPPFFHACDTETSMALALEQRVDTSKLRGEVPHLKPAFVKYDFFASGPRVQCATPPMNRLTGTGSVGDPSKATKEKGEKLLSAAVNRAVEFVAEIASNQSETDGPFQTPRHV